MYSAVVYIVFLVFIILLMVWSNRPPSEAELARREAEREAEQQRAKRRQQQLANPIWREQRIAQLYELAHEAEQRSVNDWGTKVPIKYAEQAKMYLAEMQALIDLNKTEESIRHEASR